MKAGTRGDSHMFFLNRDISSGAVISVQGSLTFATDILGTFSDVNGSLRLAPTDYLGAPVGYQNFTNRGLELWSKFVGVVTFSGKTVISSFLNVTRPDDWGRDVTIAAIPVPAALPLRLAGLGGLGFMARHKKPQSRLSDLAD
ncbi:hypothetical protein [Roseobacter fucihabitans]|uniref:hypothetical protein n=1 Tax=Roseobacter fucihabitans TaxID=1537242 RepID=UPI0016532E04|nr:hypothetical protein [Roseobacter litoralis]